ncbi:hypothetical protein [Litoreibacter arenae]|uniref:Uncharacterized protein n=1 Tax=Litoreibacter arenae DSM 19593 TaxID=1123360 RepID=S9Q8S2_9RHOB|nr:hypothetical protein [Litoreibacter arenae]EPX77781.1 hypothetical protein thalar_03508 [Litoreibacter arenae DSM 19593]
MTRQFIAALLSLSLGFSAMSTARARADEDVVKIIAGLALLGILANAAKDRNREVVTQNQHRPRYSKPNRPRQTKKVAPRRCLREQWTHRGKRDVYGARCMENRAQHALPRNCKRQVETRRGVRNFYTPNCLRKNGWNA